MFLPAMLFFSEATVLMGRFEAPRNPQICAHCRKTETRIKEKGAPEAWLCGASWLLPRCRMRIFAPPTIPCLLPARCMQRRTRYTKDCSWGPSGLCVSHWRVETCDQASVVGYPGYPKENPRGHPERGTRAVKLRG